MMDRGQENAVADRLLVLQLAELGRGPQAPGHRVTSIARASADRRTRSSAPMPWLFAAAVLVGIGTTIAVAINQRGGSPQVAGPTERTAAAPDEPAASSVAVTAAPAPRPPSAQEPRQEPQPAGRDTPTPKGTDPADLKVLRSAEAMLAAEQRLQQKLAEGKIAGVDELLPFEKLSKDWTYSEGLQGIPRPVRELDGRRVVMIGFMLPIDEVKGMKEFLLVESLWSCCFGTPPDVHQIVRCVMPSGKSVDYEFEPVLLVGEFRVEETRAEGYVTDVFHLDVDYLELLE